MEPEKTDWSSTGYIHGSKRSPSFYTEFTPEEMQTFDELNDYLQTIITTIHDAAEIKDVKINFQEVRENCNAIINKQNRDAFKSYMGKMTTGYLDAIERELKPC